MSESSDNLGSTRIGRRTLLIGGAAAWLSACASNGGNAGGPDAPVGDDTDGVADDIVLLPAPTVPSTVAPDDSVVVDAVELSAFVDPWSDLDSEAMRALGASVLAADPGAVEHARTTLASAPGESDRERFEAALDADARNGAILSVAEWSMPRTMGGVAAALFARSTR